jgi:LmbE family N-acetylglucosaminyl deacetylase
MMHLSLDTAGHPGPTILCLGSHSDDIEIGCGGTLLHLAQRYPGSVFHWVVFSAVGARENEARLGAELFAGKSNLRGTHLKQFSDGLLPFAGNEVKAHFEELKRSISPDIIFTHYRKDAHQDHLLLAELTWNTFRDHLILEYEIPKYDGDLGQPNLFVPLTQELCQRKVRTILDVFQSQRSKRWFEESTFLSLLRIRGMECNSPSGYAEAFYCRKVVL